MEIKRPRRSSLIFSLRKLSDPKSPGKQDNFVFSQAKLVCCVKASLQRQVAPAIGRMCSSVATGLYGKFAFAMNLVHLPNLFFETGGLFRRNQLNRPIRFSLG
jgi:hypothetical protein